MKRLIVAAATLLPALTSAAKPEDVFKREVVLVAKRVPVQFKSADAFIRFLRENRAVHIWPAKTKRAWKFSYMSFFAAPLDDIQVQVRLSDVTDGTARFVAAFDQFTTERGQRILSSDLDLAEPEFQPNRQYKIEIVSRGRVMASTKFWLRGQGERYSGRVSFTEEETRE
jgi:hypothetical protein